MAKVPLDGNVKVAFVPGEDGIANLGAPTVAELTATGVIADMAQHMTPDGLDLTIGEDEKDTTTLASTSNTSEPGRTKPAITIKYFRYDDPTEDSAYTTLKRNVIGTLVVRRGQPESQAFVAADKLETYQVTCGEQQPVAVAANMDDQIQQGLYPSGTYNRDAVVGP